MNHAIGLLVAKGILGVSLALGFALAPHVHAEPLWLDPDTSNVFYGQEDAGPHAIALPGITEGIAR